MTDHQIDTPHQQRTLDGDDAGSAFDYGSDVAVVASLLLSIASYGFVPAQLRIHWTLGAGPYYGPEVLPRAAVLFGFPILVSIAGLVGRWAVRRARASGRIGDTRPVDALLAVVAPTFLVVTQLVIVVANL